MCVRHLGFLKQKKDGERKKFLPRDWSIAEYRGRGTEEGYQLQNFTESKRQYKHKVSQFYFESLQKAEFRTYLLLI